MSCPTCGRQIGACVYTTEGEVTSHRPLSRGMAALLGRDPTRPQVADAALRTAPTASTAPASGADQVESHRIGMARSILEEALQMLRTGSDSGGNHFDDFRLRIAYAEKSIEIALRDLPRMPA